MDTTNSDHKEQLRKLICESIDQSMFCPSMLEIQDIDFRVVRIEQKLDSIIRFLKRRVKPLIDDISADESEEKNSKTL